jgi:hypothetical protein
MWLPRLRFTVRRMMVAVATLSLLLGIVIESLRLLRLRANYLSLAAVHAREIASLNLTEHKMQESRDALKVRGIGFLDPSGFLGPNSYLLGPYKRIVSFENYMGKLSIRRRWHERMKEKYERAASRPWITAEPEPPPF